MGFFEITEIGYGWIWRGGTPFFDENTGYVVYEQRLRHVVIISYYPAEISVEFPHILIENQIHNYHDYL